MNAKEFKEKLLKSLNSLTDEDIKRIRDEYNSEGDYDWGLKHENN